MKRNKKFDRSGGSYWFWQEFQFGFPAPIPVLIREGLLLIRYQGRGPLFLGPRERRTLGVVLQETA